MVKPFLNTYTLSWKPDKKDLTNPYYRSLANLIKQDIESGELQPYTKLPPQRELARYLDLNVSTVTKAYHLCETQGLVNAVVGRGSFVAPTAVNRPFLPFLKEDGIINMGTLEPAGPHPDLIRRVGLQVLEDPHSAQLFGCTGQLGFSDQFEAGIAWLSDLGVRITKKSLLIAMGSSHAYNVILSSLLEEGSCIAVEHYTNPSFISAAAHLRMKLIPVSGDEEGMRPDRFETACKAAGVRALFLQPSGNPTNMPISEQRREELVATAKRHGVIIIEDDAFVPFRSRRLIPMWQFSPEQVIYLSGLSLPISGGIKVAYLAVPRRFKKDLAQGIFASIFKLPPFDLAVATELIKRGLHRRILDEKREMLRYRNTVYQNFFPDQKVDLESPAQWLRLPEGLHANACEKRLHEKGLRCFSSSLFATSERAQDNALFVATCSPRSLEQVRHGLGMIKELLTL